MESFVVIFTDLLDYQGIENDKPAALLAQYKLQKQKEFKTGYNPLREISLNGQNTTLVTDFSVIKGKQRPDYAVICATGKIHDFNRFVYC